MRVAEGGVGDEEAFLIANPLGKFFGAELEEFLPGAWWRCLCLVVAGADGGRDRRIELVPLGVGIAIDDDITDEVDQLGGAVTACLELEQLRRLG